VAQLILLPGLAADAVMWQAQLTALAAQSAEWQPHVTDVHSRHGSIEEMAAALLSEHPGDLVLCGASMGGIIAMEVVRQAPQRIRGLVLLGTNARPETAEMRTLREGAIAVFFREGGVEEIIRANVALAFHPRQAANPALVESYLAFVFKAGASQLIRQNRAIMSRPDARVHLPRVACPTLVMCGDADQLTPPDCSREIADLIPGAELIWVPQCGHMLTMEKPAVVNAALLGWLSRLPAAHA
jgi:pimeloyl-ACP methyl ester carboxylesterase